MLSFKNIEELLFFRRLAYNVGLMYPHLEEGNKSYRCLSTCIYAGKEFPYPYSNDLFDCFELPDLARGKIFNPLDLVDLTVLTQEALLQDATAGLVEIILK